MSIEAVKEYLKEFSYEDKILEFDSSSATVELAARALNCEGKRIAKTLSFLVQEKPVLIVTAGDSRIDNPKFRAQFRTKAKMIPFNDVENYIGHKAGGVCPFGIKDGVCVYLDISLKRFKTVYPACGSANSAIELTISELEKLSKSLGWVDVCRDWE